MENNFTEKLNNLNQNDEIFKKSFLDIIGNLDVIFEHIYNLQEQINEFKRNGGAKT